MKKGNEKVINKLRRLATNNHKPMVKSYIEQYLSNPTKNLNLDLLSSELNSMNNFKKVAVINAIQRRVHSTGLSVYNIRNGKFFIKENTRKQNNINIATLLSFIYNDLISSLKKKACIVKANKNIVLALPSSEKSFIGNIPFGSYINFENNDVILGIHRQKEQANGFLDLSLISKEGTKYGWNASFTNKENSIIFSGDIQDSRKETEVAEMFYAKNGFNQTMALTVNNYERNDTIKYRFFLAKEKVSDLKRNYMVNPNSVIFSTELETTSKEMVIGVTTPSKFIFTNVRFSDKNVSSGNTVTSNYLEYSSQLSDNILNLNTVLELAGFNFVEEGDCDIDFNNLDKTTIINLLN